MIKSYKEYQAKPEITICFSGHRPKGLGLTNPRNNYRPLSYQTLIQDITNILYTYTQHGIIRFITGGAQGWDMLCFQAVQNLKRLYPSLPIQNIVFIPFQGQESRWLKTGLFSQQDYQQMLQDADAVYTISDITNQASYPLICRALQQRNEAMVNASSICIFPELYGRPLENMKGGTANCFTYASRRIKVCKIHYEIIGDDILHATNIS